MNRRLWMILALFCLTFSVACQPITTSPAPLSSTALPAYLPSPTLDHTRPPTGLTIVAIPQSTQRAPAKQAPTQRASTAGAVMPSYTPRPVRGAARAVVQGRVFDVAQGTAHRWDGALLAWQFAAADRQQDNGRMVVPANGLYRLELYLRPTDELFITVQAPGYLPSTTRLQSNQLRAWGTQLDFALVGENGPAPTVPGALGTIQVNGIVYNVARGLKTPVDGASIVVVNHSIVLPGTPLEITSNVSGSFTATLALHTTDQVHFAVTARGYLTTTLKKTATELARNPRLLVGLRPATK
jgi:hypothetical protein